MTDREQPVTVIQADRDAAASHREWMGAPSAETHPIRSGRRDEHELAQAFARHRTAFSPPALTGDVADDLDDAQLINGLRSVEGVIRVLWPHMALHFKRNNKGMDWQAYQILEKVITRLSTPEASQADRSGTREEAARRFEAGDHVEHVRDHRQGVIVETHYPCWVDWKPDGRDAVVRSDPSNLKLVRIATPNRSNERDAVIEECAKVADRRADELAHDPRPEYDDHASFKNGQEHEARLIGSFIRALSTAKAEVRS